MDAARNQMRALKITPDFISTAEGSVLIEFGEYARICTATVDDGVPGFLKGSGKGWVTSEYGMLPRARKNAQPARLPEVNNLGARRRFSAELGDRCARSRIRSAGRADGMADCDVIRRMVGHGRRPITGAFCALALAF